MTGVNFDSTWRARCSLLPCNINQVDSFVQRHYLHKRPGVIVLCMVVQLDGRAVGAIIYSLPPQQTDKRYGGKTWELARLFLDPILPRNSETWVIGASIRYIKRTRKDVKFLVSYADPSQQHTGKIYQASNWNCDGMTDSGRKTPRFDYEVDGKRYSRRGHVPKGSIIVRIPRISKHRWVYPL